MEREDLRVFHDEKFDVHEFLQKEACQKDLRDLLKTMNELRNANSQTMANVLRDQTNAVIIITEQLQSLHEKIRNLDTPISQLAEEIKSLHITIKEANNNFKTMIQANKTINYAKAQVEAFKTYKTNLEITKQSLIEDESQNITDFYKLERMLMKYAYNFQLLVALSVMKRNDEDEDFNEEISKLLRLRFLKYYELNNTEEMRSIIDIYMFLEKSEEFYNIIRQFIVHPALVSILNEKYLNENKGDVKVLYQKSLDILDNKLRSIIDITRGTELSVVLECYWKIVDKLLTERLFSITSAGHADIFLHNYNETVKFLNAIEKRANCPYLVKDGRYFIEHLKRFDLQVYFEIRYQEIMSLFEYEIMRFMPTIENCHQSQVQTIENFKFKLDLSQKFYKCCTDLFSPKIFLPSLSDQFLKGFILLNARFKQSILLMLSQLEEIGLDKRCLIITAMLADLQTIKIAISNPSNKQQFPFNSIDSIALSELEEIIENNASAYNNIFNQIVTHLANAYYKEIINCLDNVNAIPRLYRRTNKNAPQEPSSYVNDAMKPIEYVQKCLKVDNLLSHEDYTGVMEKILVKCCAEYLKIVKDLLDSVGKTEEALRRIKSRKAVQSDKNRSEEMTDEGKIRLQIQIDVLFLVNQIKEKIDFNNQVLQDLVQLFSN